MDEPYLDSISQNTEKINKFIFFVLLLKFLEITYLIVKLFVFAGVFVFVEVDDSRLLGAL